MSGEVVKAVYAVGVVFGGTGQGATLPIFVDVISKAGGTPYFVVWFASSCFVLFFGMLLCMRLITGGLSRRQLTSLMSLAAQRSPALVGLCDALNGMLVVFASPSSRTPTYLQALLGNASIPMVICFRMAVLRKAPTKKQAAGAFLVLAGLVVSTAPKILGLGEQGHEDGGGMFWPVVFVMGLIPGTLMTIYQESALHTEHNGTDVLLFVFLLNFWQFVFVSLFFWLDVVPGYGMSDGLHDFLQHMANGLNCFFFGGGCGGSAFGWGLAFVSTYMVSYQTGGLLLKHTEGALWSSVVSALVTPMGISWWTVFKPQPEFHWEPEWDRDMTFALFGLLVMMPGVVLYQLNRADRQPRNSLQGDDTRDIQSRNVRDRIAQLLPSGVVFYQLNDPHGVRGRTGNAPDRLLDRGA